MRKMEAFLCEQNGKSSYHKRISIIVYGVTHTSTCTQQTTQLRCLLYTVIMLGSPTPTASTTVHKQVHVKVFYINLLYVRNVHAFISVMHLCVLFFSFTFPRHQPTLPKDFLSFFFLHTTVSRDVHTHIIPNSRIFPFYRILFMCT